MLQGPPPPKKLQRPSEGWVVQVYAKGEFCEISSEPRLVFPDWHIAWQYARHRLGKQIQLRWLWGVFPWPCQVWRTVPFKEPVTPDSLSQAAQRLKEAAKSLKDDATWITIFCECNEKWCGKPILLPSEAYDEVHKLRCIVRHAECEAIPEEGDVFMGTIANWQIWKADK